ncbi:LPXTG cell wall anchor domain-containing protein [Streptococcus oralis subsp. oralis]|uniref:SspB-related isopeptide-forming adhesin n=1 Tax=Streptococcus oralis TaxID=1303 RepID=UPI0015E5DA06|nr:SspB-related isopeptide-forming adhesin [Streptococcus oralis]MBA1351658.1 LPXTG cell wall anchor domain-containing protein [Streptococcus oralis subsp. oralis]
MSKGQEYKAYGSIRKMKTGGACGVILALAILGMVVSTGSVSADEVSTDKPVAVEKKSEVDVPISHDSLDKAVKEAKEVGVKVEVVAVQDKGVVTSETVAEKQKEIEADYVKQEKEVKKATTDYTNAKTNNEVERKAIEAENKRIAKDNAEKEATYNKAVADQKAFNDQVEKENADLKAQYEKKQATYESELAKYNKQKEELAKKGLKAEKPNVKIYGDYDESHRGSVNYYKKLTASFEGVEGLTKVKDYIGLHDDTTITGSRPDLLRDVDGYFKQIFNPKVGDSFTLHNVAENEKGEKISARFTFNNVESEWQENGKPLSTTKITIHKLDDSGSINFIYGNLVQFNTKIEFYLEKDNKKVNLAVVSMFNDVDYGQELNLTYEDGTEGIVLNPDGSDVKKVKRDGKDFYKGEYKTPWTSDVPELGVKAGDLGYDNVKDEADIPRGSILSVGYGSTLNFVYHNGEGVHSAKKVELERKWAYDKARAEGKDLPSDEEIFSGNGWAVGIFGKASASVPINVLKKPPVKPVLKEKDTKEIPKPKLEKPKELPERPKAPTVKVNYSRLRVKPSTPKPVKAIADTYGHNIDSASTFDKNVKFSLTTDYKPYSTFTADSKAVAKTWAMVDDVQDGAYMVDESKNTMKDSTGKNVKDLFKMYHVLSDKERTQEIQNILKEAGLNPKGEFYMFVAKDSVSFYKNYVKQAKNITIDLPARLLVKKAELVKNDFYQVDYGNSYISNLVTVQVPDVKPEKHALDKTGKNVLDGKEVLVGEFIQYLLDGVTVPTKHDTLYQYDGIDKLDVKHDRYTGKWKGIIRGTEYLAEKDLVLPYDVVLSDGKVVKAGDKIAKGSVYAFQFEFDQSTNSEFIRKIVKVSWNEKDGKWAYTIDKEFLNSLGVQGTFDADFYIEVERIASGDVENTFVNVVNGQEMEAKVVTHTPEQPKPQEPKKPSLPNTGTASSMLGFVGTGILSMLGLVGVKRKKD